MNPADIAAAVTAHSKAILLGFPCNPTGAVASRAHLMEIARIAVSDLQLRWQDGGVTGLAAEAEPVAPSHAIMPLSRGVSRVCFMVVGFDAFTLDQMTAAPCCCAISWATSSRSRARRARIVRALAISRACKPW